MGGCVKLGADISAIEKGWQTAAPSQLPTSPAVMALPVPMVAVINSEAGVKMTLSRVPCAKKAIGPPVMPLTTQPGKRPG